VKQPAESPVPVVIVHQSPVLRAGLAELLSRRPDIHLRGDCASAADLLRDPVPTEHVLLYDLGAAHHDGVERLKQIRERIPQARVLMFNVTDDDRAIIECVQVGAAGCVLEDASLEEIVSAIHSLAGGTPTASPRVITSLFKYVATLSKGEEPLQAERMTVREEQILALLAEGLSNKEIAHQVHLQPQTVKNYAHLIFQKLDVHSRLDLLRVLRGRR